LIVDRRGRNRVSSRKASRSRLQGGSSTRRRHLPEKGLYLTLLHPTEKVETVPDRFDIGRPFGQYEPTRQFVIIQGMSLFEQLGSFA